jgi:hypothetical protein
VRGEAADDGLGDAVGAGLDAGRCAREPAVPSGIRENKPSAYAKHRFAIKAAVRRRAHESRQVLSTIGHAELLHLLCFTPGFFSSCNFKRQASRLVDK